MANALYKSIITTVIPGQPAIAGSPGSAGQAARTEFLDFDSPEATLFFLGVFGGVSVPTVSYGPFTSVPFGESLTIGTGTFNNYYLAYSGIFQRPRIRLDYPFIPASPPTIGVGAVPDQIITDLNIGWNATANSLANTLVVTPPRAYTMDIVIPNNTRGAIVGASAYTENSVQNGFQMVGSVLSLIANRTVFQSAVAHADGDTLRMVSAQNLTEYYVAGTLVARVNTDTPPTPAKMFATLYVGGDFIKDPVIGLAVVADLAFLPLAMTGGETAANATHADMEFAALTMEAQSSTPMHFLPLQITAGTAQVSAYLEFLPLTLDAASTGGPVVTFAYGALALQPLRVDGFLALRTGNGSMSFKPLEMLAANKTYAAADMAFELMTMSAVGFIDDPKAGFIGGATLAGDTITGLSIISVAISENMTLAVAIVGQSLADGSMTAATTLDDTYITQTIADALMTTAVAIGADSPLFSEPGTVWVVNAQTNASSTYANYEFNSYARINGKYFGLRADGLYSLDAAADGLVPVVGTVDFGQQVFGDTAQARVHDVYIGVSTVGTMYLRVTANGQTYTYRSNRSNKNMTVQRVVPGKGIKANWLGFQLLNSEDADFELKTIQFNAVKLTRRI